MHRSNKGRWWVTSLGILGIRNIIGIIIEFYLRKKTRGELRDDRTKCTRGSAHSHFTYFVLVQGKNNVILLSCYPSSKSITQLSVNCKLQGINQQNRRRPRWAGRTTWQGCKWRGTVFTCTYQQNQKPKWAMTMICDGRQTPMLWLLYVVLYEVCRTWYEFYLWYD